MQETNPSNALVVEGLDVHIEGDHILKHVDVTFPAHRITCIVGPSGCGKSTLLRSLNRLTENIDNFQITGRILIGGQDIVQAHDAELIELRRRVGLVPQRPCPLPMSIFDNVAYGCRIHGMHRRKAELAETVERYLTEVGLWDEVKDRLNKSAQKLSIGQQQRLCLARSLAVEPEFILADEATSALDPVSSKTVEDLFVRLKEKYTIIMVTHTLRQAQRIADNAVFLYLGEVIECGDATQVFQHPLEDLTRNYLSGTIS